MDIADAISCLIFVLKSGLKHDKFETIRSRAWEGSSGKGALHNRSPPFRNAGVQLKFQSDLTAAISQNLLGLRLRQLGVCDILEDLQLLSRWYVLCRRSAHRRRRSLRSSRLAHPVCRDLILRNTGIGRNGARSVSGRVPARDRSVGRLAIRDGSVGRLNPDVLRLAACELCLWYTARRYDRVSLRSDRSLRRKGSRWNCAVRSLLWVLGLRSLQRRVLRLRISLVDCVRSCGSVRTWQWRGCNTSEL
jgi:hypothetical protein